MTYHQFCIETTSYESPLTSAQRQALYKEKWASKKITWEGGLRDLSERDGIVFIEIAVLVGYSENGSPDHSSFYAKMSADRAGPYLTYNKGDAITITGILPTNLEEIGPGPRYYLLEAQAERRKEPPPKKKSFWSW
jgi:hypothetical protein